MKSRHNLQAMPHLVPQAALSALCLNVLCVSVYSKVVFIDIRSRLRTAIDDTNETLELLLTPRTHTTSEQLRSDHAARSKHGDPA